MMMARATSAQADMNTLSSASRRVLAACSIGSLIALSTLIVYPFGLFAIAIARDAQWSAAATAGLIGPALLILIPAQPVVGWIVGRYDGRRVTICAMVALVFALLLLATAPLVLGWFQFILTLAIILGSLATPAIYSAIISKTFDRRRGLALGFALSFTGLGVAVLPFVASFIIERWGWRAAYGGFAGLAALGALTVALLVPRPPDLPAANTSSAIANDRDIPPVEGGVVGDRTFWISATIFVLVTTAANSVPLHLPIILQQRGAGLNVAATSLGVMGITMIVGRPLVGYLLDILPIRIVLAIILGGPMLGSIALLTTGGTAVAILAAVGFGLAVGGEFACLGYMVSRAFRPDQFGIVYGWLAMAVATGVAAGPIGISILLRLGEGYTPPLLMVVTACVLGLGATLTLTEAAFRRSRPA